MNDSDLANQIKRNTRQLSFNYTPENTKKHNNRLIWDCHTKQSCI